MSGAATEFKLKASAQGDFVRCCCERSVEDWQPRDFLARVLAKMLHRMVVGMPSKQEAVAVHGNDRASIDGATDDGDPRAGCFDAEC